MKSTRILILAAVAALSTPLAAPHAIAEPTPDAILNQYQAQAQKLIKESEVASSESDVSAMIKDTQDLIQLGSEVMAIYEQANPDCEAQYNSFLTGVGMYPNATADEVKNTYIHANGLPTGPKHCYYGRATVGQPWLALIRLKGKYDDAVFVDAEDAYNEAIEHFKQLVANIDNPPSDSPATPAATPGPAASKNDQLGKDMKQMNADYKVLRVQIKDATKNASSLAAIEDMIAATSDAAKISPDMITTLPAEQQAASLAQYQSLMNDVLTKLNEMHASLTQNDNATAANALVELGSLKSQGHSIFED